MEQIMQKAITAIKSAGSIINSFEAGNTPVFEKSASNCVTQIDYNVEAFLVSELSKILPESNIITEEATQNQFDFSKPTWILDPVDGTTNLMHSYNHSAISLALFIDKKPQIGIIYNPYNEELFTAEFGLGAFLNGKKIQVSSNKTLDKSLICFGTSPYEKEKSEKVFSITHKIFLSCQDIRRSGSAALDIAYVACGRLDAYFELNLKPWDFAGGILILLEAGGKITNWKGIDPDVSVTSNIIASNGYIHDLVMNNF
jgi:myo-inositol-1(or 4)-monophosphatase